MKEELLARGAAPAHRVEAREALVEELKGVAMHAAILESLQAVMVHAYLSRTKE